MRPSTLYALPASQRQLMTLILRKLLVADHPVDLTRMLQRLCERGFFDFGQPAAADNLAQWRSTGAFAI